MPLGFVYNQSPDQLPIPVCIAMLCCVAPPREVLEGANELRVMLCRDKLVQSGSGTKRGTSVLAACGEQPAHRHMQAHKHKRTTALANRQK